MCFCCCTAEIMIKKISQLFLPKILSASILLHFIPAAYGKIWSVCIDKKTESFDHFLYGYDQFAMPTKLSWDSDVSDHCVSIITLSLIENQHSRLTSCLLFLQLQKICQILCAQVISKFSKHCLCNASIAIDLPMLLLRPLVVPTFFFLCCSSPSSFHNAPSAAFWTSLFSDLLSFLSSA